MLLRLDENGILTIRLVIDLTTTTDILDESGLAQLSQFALGCPYPVPARRVISRR